MKQKSTIAGPAPKKVCKHPYSGDEKCIVDRQTKLGEPGIIDRQLMKNTYLPGFGQFVCWSVYHPGNGKGYFNKTAIEL